MAMSGEAYPLAGRSIEIPPFKALPSPAFTTAYPLITTTKQLAG